MPIPAPLPRSELHTFVDDCVLIRRGDDPRRATTHRCALIDFERSEPSPLVCDFAKLATSVWPDPLSCAPPSSRAVAGLCPMPRSTHSRRSPQPTRPVLSRTAPDTATHS